VIQTLLLDTLRSNCNTNIAKYTKNYQLYWNTPYVSIRNPWNRYPLGFQQLEWGDRSDTSPDVSINLIKSCVDTLVSKIAQSKVRPYITSMDGSYRSMKAVKAVQRFFDGYTDKEHLHTKISQSFLAACVFDSSALWTDMFSNSLVSLNPWEFSILDEEYKLGILRNCLIRIDGFPCHLLEHYHVSKIPDTLYCCLEIFITLDSHKKADIYVLVNQKEEYHTTREQYRIPLSIITYNKSLVGFKQTSIVDELKYLQYIIDIILSKIKNASQLTFEQMIILPRTGGINSQSLQGSSGYKIVQFDPVPGMTMPIQLVTPPFIDEQYIRTLEWAIQQGYNQIGISPLSAQSVKPTGLDSGVALQSMQNIENDRFQTQLDGVVNCYTETAYNILYCLDEQDDEDWAAVKEATETFHIQYSAADAFSKDPSQKLKEIMQLTQVGIIPQYRVPEFLEIPDLQKVYSISMVKSNAVQRLLEDVIEKGEYTIPPEVDAEILEGETVKLINQLYGDRKDQDVGYSRLLEFRQYLYDYMEEAGLLATDTAVDSLGNERSEQQNEMQVSEGGIGLMGNETIAMNKGSSTAPQSMQATNSNSPLGNVNPVEGQSVNQIPPDNNPALPESNPIMEAQGANPII